MGYDAFISYSHDADSDLAPELQDSLQRFSKPWYRRKPFVSVVRDATSFGASASLEGTIHEALDEANHFVLLLSPESAESPWINDEVAHWIATRGVDQMTFVVTRWRGDDLSTTPGLTDLGKFEWNGPDVPPALHGAIEEPLAVDLRWAQSSADRSLKNEQWRDGVAEIAAGIRDQNKDELIGAVVAMRTRARILTGTILLGSVILLAATALGVGGWVLANQARGAAIEDRDLAQIQQVDAETARDRAQTAELEAAARADAAQSAQVAAEEAAGEAEAATAVALANLDEARGAVTAAEEDLAQAQTDLGATRADLTTTKQDLTAAETNLVAAEETLATARQELIVAEADLATATLEARSVAAGSRSIALLNEDSLTAALVGLAALDIMDTPGARDALVTLNQRSNVVSSVVSAAGSPLGRYPFAFLDRSRLLVADGESIGIHDTLTGLPLTSFPPAEAPISDLAYSEASGLMAAADPAGITVWRVEHPSLVRRFEGHAQPPGALAWGPEGRQIASVSASELLVWDAATGAVLARQASPHESGPFDVAFSPDGDLIVTAGLADLAFWDGKGIQLGAVIDIGPSLNFVQLAFSPDGAKLASTSSVAVLLWDTVTRTRIGEVLHSDIVTAVAFSNRGNLLATGAIDETLRLWDVETGREVARLSRDVGQQLEFSPDDRYLAVGATFRLPILDVAEFAAPDLPALMGGPVGAVGNGGRLLAVADSATVVRFVDARTGDQAAPDLAVAGPIESLAFDGPNQHLAVAGSNHVSIYEMETRSRTAGPYEAPGDIKTVTMSRDGQLLAATGETGAWLFDVSTGGITELFDLIDAGAEGPVQSVAFGSSDRILTVAAGTTEIVFTTIDLVAGTREVESIQLPFAFDLDLAPGLGTFTVATGRETLRIHDRDSGEPLGDEIGQRLTPGQFALTTTAFSPDGQHVAFWTPTSGSWQILAGGVDSWSRRACAIAGRNLSVDEWNGFFPPAVPYAVQCDQFPAGN